MRRIPKLTSVVLFTAFSAATLTVTDLVAQGRAGTRADIGRSPAASMLRLREQLNLSEEQVKQLEGLRQQSAVNTNRAEMMRARADLLEARKGEVNVERARSAYERIAKSRTDQRVAQLQVRQDVSKVLTADQKSKVKSLTNRARHRRGATGLRGGNRGRNSNAVGRAGQGNRRPPINRPFDRLR